MKKNYRYERERKQNPFTGIVSFQHFTGEKLYNDVICEGTLASCETENLECYPIPEGVKENGREQGWYPENSVAYFRCLWKDFEPKQGEYNYQFIQDIIDECKAHGQTLMFRLMPHSTCERDDVPDWLKEIIDCPARPEGMRVKDSPTDRRYLLLFAEAIKKFAERFDEEPVLTTIDICLPGAWGEGHQLGKYDQADLLYVMDTYIESFPNTFIFGQIAGAEFMKYIAEKRPVGWRADGVGSPRHMSELIPAKLEKAPQGLWKTSPVSAESYWWLGEWFRRDWDIDSIIQTTLSWHISTFNPKSLPIPYEWREKIEGWNAKMGYHFHLYETDIPQTASEKLHLILHVENVGVAPIYQKTALTIFLKNERGSYAFDTEVDPRKWLPGKWTEEISLRLPADMPRGEYEVCLSLVSAGYSIELCSDIPSREGQYILGRLAVRA